jgi:hypothetical protein
LFERGLGFRESEVTYGVSLIRASVTSGPPGDIPPGESRPNDELTLVMLLAAIDNVEEAYELFRGPDVVDETEPEVEW